MLKKALLIIITSIVLSGCDSIYHYIFLPPGRVELTIMPDPVNLRLMKDSGYSISADGQAMIYDAKNWKIEVRYMSDYQLNTFEFPEESKDREFSGNPFTYANWIDPTLGYTPLRFTVFKVSIYNYTSTKINIDPELAVLETERGDKFKAYAREKKNAKNFSIEEYYQKRKGSAGVQDDVYETRMGIARRTMLSFGKPIYKGDSREGLIVFDPIVESISKMKVTIKNFILSYDENNEPSEFKDLTFYFEQVPVKEEELLKRKNESDASDSSSVLFTMGQLKYTVEPGRSTFADPWDPVPLAAPHLIDFSAINTNQKWKHLIGTIEEETVKKSKILFLFGNGLIPDFNSTFVSEMTNYLLEGGFLYIDNCYFTTEYPFTQLMEDLVTKLQRQLKGKIEYKQIGFDHPIFNIRYSIPSLPEGMDDRNSSFMKMTKFKGLFIENKLVLVLSSKGYPLMWADEDPKSEESKQLQLGVNLLLYATQNQK